MKVEEYMSVREKVRTYDLKTKISDPSDVADFLRDKVHVDKYDREHFFVLCLNSASGLTCFEDIACGARSECLVDITSIFKTAILAGARAIIIAHNHPSGEIEPSESDIELTSRIKKAGEILDMELCDHVIIGDSFSSMKELGYI